MTVRAATAKLTDDQDERLLALDDIERIGRASTAELRRMLSILRDPEARSNAPMRPADTLEQLPGIIDTARRAGIDLWTRRRCGFAKRWKACCHCRCHSLLISVWGTTGPTRTEHLLLLRGASLR